MTQVQDAALEKQSTGSLLEQIIRETNLDPQDEGYEAARLGVSAFIEEMLKPSFAGEQVKKITVDRMIAELDRRLSAQTDEILHNSQFQELESAWRGLGLLVDRTDFRENISVEMLHVSKDELLDDFLDASEITQSSLYKLAYTAEYGQFGGKPLGAVIGNYYFEHHGHGHAPAAEPGQRFGHGPRAVHRLGRPLVLRVEQLRPPAGPQGPPGHLQRSAATPSGRLSASPKTPATSG